MNPVIGIRANAGPAVGFGHIRRCVSLAEALLQRGAKVVFFANPESDPSAWLPRHGSSRGAIELVPATEAATLTITNARVSALNVAALVVDSYDTGAEAMAAAPVPVAAILDAPPSQPLPASLIVNTAADAARLEHPLAPGARALLGPQFTLLRSEFAQPPERRVRPDISRVLVMAGGSDATGLSLIFVAAVRAVLKHVALDIVIGPYFPPSVASELREKAAADPLLTVVETPVAIRELMVASDIALTAGGQTTCELAAAGVPACAVRVASNQTPYLEGFQARRTLVWAGDIGDADLQPKIEQAIRALHDDRGRRQSMSEAGRNTVDGCGATRVADAILELCA